MHPENEIEIEIGDLVRLADDDEHIVGIGIVIDVANNNEFYINDNLVISDFSDVDDPPDDIADKKLYLHRPVYLVLWSGDKNFFAEDSTSVRPLWFFKNELKLVNKASK